MMGQPAKKGDHVDVAIDALGVDQRGEAQQGRGGHVVAGDREAVLEAGDAAARSVEVGRRLRAASRPVGDAEGHRDEQHEHPDGVQVERLLFGGGDRVTGKRQGPARGAPAAQDSDGPALLHLLGCITDDFGGDRVKLAIGALYVDRGQHPEEDEHEQLEAIPTVR